MITRKTRLAAPFVVTAVLSVGVAAGMASGVAWAGDRKLPKAEHPERVHRSDDGVCTEYPSTTTACPPGMHCNPGPPHEVECPPERVPKKK